MASKPRFVLGNLVNRSIVICSHFQTGISNGWSLPYGFWCSALTCKHVKHFSTYFATSLFIPGHQ
ncbi:hypothetical protein Hanom_Chr06g00509811 [Helianthus anomalus]